MASIHHNNYNSTNNFNMSTAILFTTIGTLASLETVLHHLGAVPTAEKLNSLVRDLQDLVTPGPPQITPRIVGGPIAEPRAPVTIFTTVETPKCSTCTDGVPFAGRFLRGMIETKGWPFPKRCRTCIGQDKRAYPRQREVDERSADIGPPRVGKVGIALR